MWLFQGKFSMKLADKDRLICYDNKVQSLGY